MIIEFIYISEYIHTGCVTLQPRTLLGMTYFTLHFKQCYIYTQFLKISLNFYLQIFLGVMNAADYYGLDELKCACSGFIQVFPVYTHVA